MPRVAQVEIDLRVDRDGELPVASQLAWKLRAMVGGGLFPPGDKLPSVRELADLAEVNVNTARSVYRRLEEDGFIVSRHGAGTFVADAPPSAGDVDRIAADVVSDARGAGVDPRELATAIYAAADLSVNGNGAGDRNGGGIDEPPSRVTSTPLPDPEVELDERAARRELRRQIAHLEAELGSYAEHLSKDESSTHPLLRPKAHVADLEELERTRTYLHERLTRVRNDVEERGRRQQEARAHVEEMVRAPEKHKWEWVSSDDTGDPGCKTWHTRPRYGLIGMFMGWWRVKVSSGCPLAGPREAAPRGMVRRES
jgi:DNA-binding transcriptional regulator YhcF (GntR family)